MRRIASERANLRTISRDHQGLIEGRFDCIQPSDFCEARDLKRTGQLRPPKSSIAGSLVIRNPSGKRFAREIEMECIEIPFPIPYLVDDAAQAVVAEEGRRLRLGASLD